MNMLNFESSPPWAGDINGFGLQSELECLQRRAEADGRRCVVGAVIINSFGEVFLQRRAPNVRLFPGCWDIVGGHVELGETLYAALAREIDEETGWRLATIKRLVRVFDWEGNDGERKREIDVLATVDGELTRPRIEYEKFTEGRWLDEIGLRKLVDQADTDDAGMIELALQVLGWHNNR